MDDETIDLIRSRKHESPLEEHARIEQDEEDSKAARAYREPRTYADGLRAAARLCRRMAGPDEVVTADERRILKEAAKRIRDLADLSAASREDA